MLLLKFFLLPHFDESPRVCWKDTRTSIPCDCAAARYVRSRVASKLPGSSATSHPVITRTCLKPTCWNNGSPNMDAWFSEIPTRKAAEAVDGSASASTQAARSVKRERIAKPG